MYCQVILPRYLGSFDSKLMSTNGDFTQLYNSFSHLDENAQAQYDTHLVESTMHN